MTTVQAIAFGAMLAWTPALIIMAYLLWDVPDLDQEDQTRRAEAGPEGLGKSLEISTRGVPIASFAPDAGP